MTIKYVMIIAFILGSVAVGMETFKEMGITVTVGKKLTQEITPVSTETPTPTAGTTAKAEVSKAVPTSTRKAIVLPSPTIKTTGTSTGTAVASSRCIVTLFGSQYDVTPLINSHSGGDVFSGNCNTDMSAIYQRQHGTSVAQMRPYLVTNSSSQVMPTAQAQTNQDRRGEREDEDEDD